MAEIKSLRNSSVPDVADPASENNIKICACPRSAWPERISSIVLNIQKLVQLYNPSSDCFGFLSSPSVLSVEALLETPKETMSRSVWRAIYCRSLESGIDKNLIPHTPRVAHHVTCMYRGLLACQT